MSRSLMPTMKILFVDYDETCFQVRQCIAQALDELPPVDLYHAVDATEALLMLETMKPDVIVIDEELSAEKDLFMDSLPADHPPILIVTEDDESSNIIPSFSLEKGVNYIPRGETLDGIHQTLMLATAVATKSIAREEASLIH